MSADTAAVVGSGGRRQQRTWLPIGGCCSIVICRPKSGDSDRVPGSHGGHGLSLPFFLLAD